jgi:MoaA/NifB/PqqE/SkfB family radical SAM enzyme
MCQVDRRKAAVEYPELTLDKLERIAKEFFPTLKYINLTRRGEPFMDPNFNRIVELCEQYSVKMDINTNGTLMNEKWLSRILPLLSDVKVSIDSPTDDMFERIRTGGKLGAVLDNVRHFIRLRKQMLEPADYPKLSFEVTLMKSNVDQIGSIIKLAQDLGVECVKAYHLFVFHPEFEGESLVFYKERFNQAFKECMELGKELGVEVKMAEPFLLSGKPKILENRTCPRIWRRLWIDFNGDILPCLHPMRRVLGNMNSDNIMDIWNSPAYQGIRKGEDPMCNRCGWLKVSDNKSPIPYDDAFLCHTWKILEDYRTNKAPEEKTIGAEYDVLWSRRTAQMPLP